MVRDLLALGAVILAFAYFLQVDTGTAGQLESPPPSPPVLALSSSPARARETPSRFSLGREHLRSLPSEKGETEGIVRAAHVIDGDTIILADGRQVRYVGIDTPELGDRRLAAAAEQAREANRRLVGDRDLRLERDVQTLDRYGRVLAYVWADDTFVNEELLRAGWARLLTIPPDVRYVERFREAARQGAEKRRTIWSPSQPGRVAGSATTGIDCPLERSVKGNINRQGEKIYHLPSGAFYERTRPEECFATVAEAERAGFRASRR